MSSPLPQSPAPAYIPTERRPQADALPVKRGEIGFVEGLHSVAPPSSEYSPLNLPERHPADRRISTPGTEAESSTNTPSTNGPTSPLPDGHETAGSSSVSISKSAHILGFLKPQKSIGGVQSSTVILFSAQLLLLAGTGIAWFFTEKLLQRMSSKGQDNPIGRSSSVFVRVIFIVAVLAQLVFLERRLFRMRGERYSHLHPGEVLPRHRRMPVSSESATIAFAPWNRPPLPTYAAALSQSGVGTGDVEDNLIAAPPPPAYGNTRGSTLILQGYLRHSLRLQRPVSVHSQASASGNTSYAIRGEQPEEMDSLDRSRRLEETLNRLEATSPSSRQHL